MHQQVVLRGNKETKEKILDMSMRMLEKVDQNEEVKTKILSKYNNVEKRRTSIINDDMSSQKMNLQKRLAQRKFKRSSNKFQGAITHSGKGGELQSADDEHGTGNSTQLDDFEVMDINLPK